MLNKASQPPIPPLKTNVGVAAAVVAVIVEGPSSDFPELERKRLEKPGLLSFTKEQQLKTRALSLLGGRGDISSLFIFLCLGLAVWLLLSVGGVLAGGGGWDV